MSSSSTSSRNDRNNDDGSTQQHIQGENYGDGDDAIIEGSPIRNNDDDEDSNNLVVAGTPPGSPSHMNNGTNLDDNDESVLTPMSEMMSISSRRLKRKRSESSHNNNGNNIHNGAVNNDDGTQNDESQFAATTQNTSGDGSLPVNDVQIDPQEQEDDEITQQQQQQQQDEVVIWGTDVHVPTAERAFRDFLKNFISINHSKKQQQRRRNNNNTGDINDDDSTSVDSFSTTSSNLDNNNQVQTRNKEKQVYMNRLREIALSKFAVSPESANNSDVSTTTNNSLDLDCQHLYFHSEACQRLYHQLLKFPQEIVPLMDLIINDEYKNIVHNLIQEERLEEVGLEEIDIEHTLQVRPYNLRKLSHMRSLDPLDMDSLICLKGMVVRTSPIIPDLKVAFFSCSVCGTTKEVTIDKGRIAEPSGRCDECNAQNSYTLLHNRCTFADKQMVRLQETPDEVPAGETPASIVLFAYDDLVDSVKPGDRVEVSGVFRAMAKRVNPKISKVKTVYKTYIDVIHFQKVGKAGTRNGTGNKENVLGRGISNTNQRQIRGANTYLTEERIKQLEALSKDRNIYEKLTQSLAPSIWELDDVKKGVLCMLFGGNSKRIKKKKEKNTDNDNSSDKDLLNDSSDEEEEENDTDDDDENDRNDLPTRKKLSKRGDINILLCGDPGTSKSQLLSYVHKLAPRGVYTSGKGSSAVGLTASIVRDPETREIVLESGALVLSDQGICCIDEFDKMSDTTRAILHEAMEQQTVSIAKAGIIATLNARTSILASANPVESRYNPKKSVVENIQLPPTLLSRFDLIYLVLDQPNADSDRRLAKHLVGLYYEQPDIVEPPLSHDLLKDYIHYARENIHPELSDLATQELIRSYLDMRRGGSTGSSSAVSSHRTISATPRQLESLVRLSEALAKMRFSRTVERKDVLEAVRLMKVATQTAATDPRTGRIDMDMITTGRSQADKEARDALVMTMKELFAERRGNRMTVGDIRRQILEITSIEATNDEVLDVLREMEDSGIVQLNERAQTVFVKTGIVS